MKSSDTFLLQPVTLCDREREIVEEGDVMKRLIKEAEGLE